MLGDLSMLYETSFSPPDYLKAAAKVSSGKGDPGGRSYGAYQLASKTPTLSRFLHAHGVAWHGRFKDLDPATDAYADAWRAVAAEEGVRFFNAQHAFIKATHYDKVVLSVHKRTGVNLDNRTDAVRNATWSMAVQHGGAARVITRAVRSCQAIGTQDNDIALLEAMYAQRRAYVDANPKLKDVIHGLHRRYTSELREALTAAERAGVKRLPAPTTKQPPALAPLSGATTLPKLRPASTLPPRRGATGSW